METINIKGEYIKLGQVLKAVNFVSSGSEAKMVIQDGLVKVNGKVQLQRGKKIYSGDTVDYNGEKIIIK